MAVKKLYTESYIADIADALRTVIGGTDTYNTQEMAATLATIHRGAKDVWIGDQTAYNALSSYDVEICYIIYENRKVMRVYAGTTIIYDDPVVWDYELPTTTFNGTFTVDTGMAIFSTANFDRPFEMLVHITDYVGGSRCMGAYDDTVYSRWTGLFAWTENGTTMRWSGTNPEFNSGPVECNYKLRRDSNRTLHIYDMDNEGELITSRAIGMDATTDATWILGAWRATDHQSVRASFTLDHFRFRWIDDE